MKTNCYTYRTHVKTMLGDMHTPVSVYLKVRDLYPQSVLMESTDYYTAENSRSFIALYPIASFRFENDQAIETFPAEKHVQEDLHGESAREKALSSFMSRFQVTGEYAEACGVFGTATAEPATMHYVLYKYVLLFNHFKNELTLIELLADGEEESLCRLEAAIENRNYASYNFAIDGSPKPISEANDNIQSYTGDDFKVYRAMRSLYPSPYLFYLDNGGQRIFGSSLETCSITSDTDCVGFIGFNGRQNQAIVTRVFKSRRNRLYFPSGETFGRDIIHMAISLKN
ncbi:MAG: hypothetical protein LBM61_00790 [Prevotellaceae bacterium]|jgi:anthranilate synthase component 1|nr:hypothetical protein [Prevotellaceae bacterium]